MKLSDPDLLKTAEPLIYIYITIVMGMNLTNIDYREWGCALSALHPSADHAHE
jgi:hypothetical protein